MRFGWWFLRWCTSSGDSNTIHNRDEATMLARHDAIPPPDDLSDEGAVEMPRPTAAPMILALGIVLLAAGAPFGVAFMIVGALVLMAGLGIWISQLLPDRGHCYEPLAALSGRPQTVQ